jgi:hypothetical protein
MIHAIYGTLCLDDTRAFELIIVINTFIVNFRVGYKVVFSSLWPEFFALQQVEALTQISGSGCLRTSGMLWGRKC